MSVYFPEEIILQILHNLPIKSLVPCMCVCKSWHSLITNPTFISTHHTRTNNHLLLFGLRSKKSEHYNLRVDNQQLAPYMPLDFPFKRCFSPYLRLIGSFNGLICLTDDVVYYAYTYILWNPLIKKALILPKPSVTDSTHGPYESFFGFGFDSKTNDYKVLRMVNLITFEDEELGIVRLPKYEDGEEASIEVELYSLNTNSWKSMTCVAPKYEFNEHDMDKHAFVNGVVHWIAFKSMRHLMFRNLVLGFDMTDEVFHEIKLPDSLAGVNPRNISVKKYGDSSIGVIQNDFCQCHIWVMKEYGVVGSWTKLLSLKEPSPRGGMPIVLGFRKSGEVLLKRYSRLVSCDPHSEGVKMQMYHGQIVSCDPQHEGVKDLGVGEKTRCAFVDGYVESLVLLDNANAVKDASVVSDVNEDDAYEESDESEDENLMDDLFLSFEFWVLLFLFIYFVIDFLVK